MRVLVVDDAALFRRAVSDALAGIPGIEVVGTSANGKLAMSRLPVLRPDLITLDIDMPEMNGLEMLEALRSSGSDAGVVLLSSLTARSRETTVRGLELGAFDFLTKPEGSGPGESISILRERLVPVLKAFERQRSRNGPSRVKTVATPASPAPPSGEEATVPSTGRPRDPRAGSPLVLIGVSTGGPAALATLLPGLPADLGAPVFIVQHMPALFTEALASNLAARTPLRVKQAEDGERAVAGSVYIAPGGRHMKLERGNGSDILIRITEDPVENNCRPSVDYLFRSTALSFPGRSVAAILTGMGNDGAQGMKMLKRSGCFTIAQDESSCVVYGMPKEAVQAGVVDLVVPLGEVAPSILREIRKPAS